MNWYKISQNDKNEEKDDFWSSFDNIPYYKVVKKDPPSFKSVILTLYRGFNADPELIKRNISGKITLSPRKSEQGVLWFTHNLIRAYNPREYVKDRGNYVLEYPLQCKKHFQIAHREDGSTSEEIPQEATSDPTSNSPFYMGYELPAGWFFSYKMEKFIICDHDIQVDVKMIYPNSDFEVYR